MRKRGLSKAQSVIAYTVLIALVAAAFLAMKVFFTRAVQAKYKQSIDTLGMGKQYEKGKTIITEEFDAINIENKDLKNVQTDDNLKE